MVQAADRLSPGGRAALVDEWRSLFPGACARVYAERLVSIVLFGSVARGTGSRSSDLDVLIVAEALPRGRPARIAEFDAVEAAMRPWIDRCWASGWRVELSPLLKTRAEAEYGSPLFLDMTEDAEILVDHGAFMATRLDTMRRRMHALGSRRVWRGRHCWTWHLKPDWKPGETIEL